MTKTEFLEAIAAETGFMPSHKRRQVMAYFNGVIPSDEPDVTEKFSTPQEALHKYLNTSRITSKIPRPLFIAALFLLAPFMVNIAMVIAVLVVVLLIFAIALLATIPIFGVSLWLDGVEIIFRSIPQAVILADKLWQLGIGFIYFAAGIAIIVLVSRLYARLIPWILGRLAALYDKIKRRTK